MNVPTDNPDYRLPATYTNDVQGDFAALLDRLAHCDGVRSDCVIITWRAARTILEAIRLIAREKEVHA